MLYPIIENLYLASFYDVSIVQNKNDYFIINCSKDLPFFTDNSMRLSVDDDCEDESIEYMSDNIPSVVDIINEKIKNEKVIVHCFAGQQRSACIVAAYLIFKMNMTVEESIEYVKTKKPDAFFWKANFIKSLQSYYNTLHN